MNYLCCSIFSFAGCMFLLCMGTILRLQPEFLPKVHTPKSSSNSCFISAGLYAGVFFGSIIMWRRELAKGGVSSSLKDSSSFEIFGTTVSYDDLEETEEHEPLVEGVLKSPKRRVPSPSIQLM